MRFRTMLPSLLIFCLCVVAVAQGNRGKAETTVKGKKVSIDYGRPSLGGQASRVGELPVGAVWRLGMDKSTTLNSAAGLVIEGKDLKAGQYSLWVKRAADKTFVLAFHPKTGVWGDPPLTEGFIAEAPLTMSQAPNAVDQLTISLADNKGKLGVKIQWGKDILSTSLAAK